VVWRHLADLPSLPEWTPTVTAIEPLTEAKFLVGARYRLTQPRLGRAVWTIQAIEDGRRFLWTSTQPGLRIAADHLIEADGPGSRLTLTLDVAGPLSPLLMALVGRISQDYVETEAQSLRQRCLAA
jgi:hypothetical protein